MNLFHNKHVHVSMHRQKACAPIAFTDGEVLICVRDEQYKVYPYTVLVMVKLCVCKQLRTFMIADFNNIKRWKNTNIY